MAFDSSNGSSSALWVGDAVNWCRPGSGISAKASQLIFPKSTAPCCFERLVDHIDWNRSDDFPPVFFVGRGLLDDTGGTITLLPTVDDVVPSIAFKLAI